jgi:hypothetical protein
VVAHQENLDNGAYQKEECANDGDGEAHSVEAADGTERCRVCDLVALSVRAEAFL